MFFCCDVCILIVTVSPTKVFTELFCRESLKECEVILEHNDYILKTDDGVMLLFDLKYTYVTLSITYLLFEIYNCL